jgi:hypothetical protein
MLLKWESFDTNASKKSSWYGTQYYALDIHVSRPYLVHAGILLISTMVLLQNIDGHNVNVVGRVSYLT